MLYVQINDLFDTNLILRYNLDLDVCELSTVPNKENITELKKKVVEWYSEGYKTLSSCKLYVGQDLKKKLTVQIKKKS